MAKNLEELDKLYGYNVSKPYDDEISKLIKQGAYDKLLNKDIQLYNLKNNAQKYYSNTLANQGIANSGYGSSAMNSIQNDAIRMYDQAQRDFYKGIDEVNKDTLKRQEAKQTELDNQLVTFIQNDTTGNIDKILENYGYIENGNYTEKWNSLTPERQAYIKSVIDNKTGAQMSGQPFSIDSNNTTAFYTQNGGQGRGTIANKFQYEVDTLVDSIQLGKLSNGSSVKLVNKWGDYIYVRYENGRLFYQTPKQYEESNNKFTIEQRNFR